MSEAHVIMLAITGGSVVRAGAVSLSKNEGFTYFMLNEGLNEVKIGYSATTDGAVLRKKTQQTGNPRPLRILGVIPSKVAHGTTERQMHRRFRRWRIEGAGREWFTNEILPAVREIISQRGVEL